jgi:hypothetical protein
MENEGLRDVAEAGKWGDQIADNWAVLDKNSVSVGFLQEAKGTQTIKLSAIYYQNLNPFPQPREEVFVLICCIFPTTAGTSFPISQPNSRYFQYF